MSDSKYRQRGYRDDGEKPQKRAGQKGPRPQREGPRGRGLGKPTATVFRCAVCGRQQVAPKPDAFELACTNCGGDLHSCTHCMHFDTAAPKQCRQPIEVAIAGKAKRNQCELFEGRVTQEFGADTQRPEDARAAFDALFDM